MKHKRLIAALLCGVMTLSMIPSAFAEDIIIEDAETSEQTEYISEDPFLDFAETEAASDSVELFAQSELTSVQVSAEYRQTEARSMLDMVNSFRTGNDAWYWNSDNKTKTDMSRTLSTVNFDADLEQIAMQRAAEIALSFSHTRPDGTICFSASSNGVTSYGENIALGARTAKQAFELWQETDETYEYQGHRRNMLSSDWGSIGIAHAVVNGIDCWVQEFHTMQGSCSTTACDEVQSMTVDIDGTQVESFSLTQGSVSVKPGEQTMLSAESRVKLTEGWVRSPIPITVNDILWTSADPSIAQVSANTVTGIADGKTTLTASVFGQRYSVDVFVETEHHWSDGQVTVPPTCFQSGTMVCQCTICGTTQEQSIPATGEHSYKNTITKATCKKNGKVVTACEFCGTVKSTKTIYAAENISLSVSSYTYNGKVKTPEVIVNDSKGKAIAEKYYTVTAPSGRKNVGTYEYTVKLKGYYSGSKTLSFQIKPKKPVISSVSAASKAFTVKWDKQTTQVTGFQIEYSTSSKFTNSTKVKATKNTTTSKKITGLKASKKYYVRLRTYKTVDGKNYYSAWTSAKTVTTKK